MNGRKFQKSESSSTQYGIGGQQQQKDYKWHTSGEKFIDESSTTKYIVEIPAKINLKFFVYLGIYFFLDDSFRI